MNALEVRALESLGVPHLIVQQAEKRAVRIGLADIPDGAKEYVPVGEDYADEKFRLDMAGTLRKIIKAAL